MLQSMGLHKVGHDLVTEQQQISVNSSLKKKHLYILRNSFHNGLALSLFLIPEKATVKSRFSKAVVSLPVLKIPRVKAQRKQESWEESGKKPLTQVFSCSCWVSGPLSCPVD